MEQDRGISITSAALQFAYRDAVINLLDTPGHADFSEDTYRVLAAVDAAVMLLDAAKGLEPQTLKLFEVCRDRGVPVITFVNKWDRPGREPLELLDEIEQPHRPAADAADLAGGHRRRLPRRGRPSAPATHASASRRTAGGVDRGARQEMPRPPTTRRREGGRRLGARPGGARAARRDRAPTSTR